ncbi:MAG: hypothetical protein WC551_02585 [Patescibacteria group bacterium]
MEKIPQEVIVKFGRNEQKDPFRTSWYRLLQVVYGLGLVVALFIVVAVAYDNKPYFNEFTYNASIGEEIKRQNPNMIFDDYTDYTIGTKAIERGTDVVAKLREKNALFTPKSETTGSWGSVFLSAIVGLIVTAVVFLGIRWIVKYIIAGK